MRTPIRHHLDVEKSVHRYNAADAGIAPDLRHRLAAPQAMLETLDPVLRSPIRLNDREFQHVLDFVRNALLDGRARKRHLCTLIPESVPSGMPLLGFEGCTPK